MARAETRFAILVGANAGWTNDRPLRHAESDAERVRDALVEVGGFSADRVELLRDPDTAELRARLRRLSDRLRASGDETLVFFYYSGHADERQLHLRGLPFTWDELNQSLRELPGRVRIALIDACRSGSILAKGGSLVKAFEVRATEPVQGLAEITSSGADELSQETRALQGSVFTHHFVSGLLGAADFDHDGKVTLSEVYRYSYERTEADTAATAVPQRPAFKFELKGQGELVMSQLPQGQAGVLLGKGPVQRYVVTDALDWKLVAEGNSRPDGDVLLALRPGEYRLKRVGLDSIEVAALTVANAAVVAAGLRYETRPISSGLVKGRPDTTDPDELREYRRGEALRLIDQGEPAAARAIFEEILRAKPDDLGSLRGKARAMVREAEAWERVSEHESELKSLKGALDADPSLSEDPDFTRWYRRIVELEAETKRDAKIEKNVEEEIAANPRLKKHWGVGVEIFGTRGLFVLEAELMLLSKLVVELGFAPIGPGFDLSLKYIPMGWKMSPWVQVGGYVSLRQIWDTGSSTITIDGQALSYWQIWSNAAHIDAGIQYFGTLGFCIEASLGFLFFPNPRESTGLTWYFFPSFAMSWFF